MKISIEISEDEYLELKETLVQEVILKQLDLINDENIIINNIAFKVFKKAKLLFEGE